MDWSLAIKEERAALTCIVALLLSLAEYACSRPRAVRAFVLWVLRPAETAARDFVTGGPDASAASIPAGAAGDSLAEAMRLASSFRDLACELERQAKLAFAFRDRQAKPVLSGACRTRDMDDFLSILRRLAFAPVAHHVLTWTALTAYSLIRPLRTWSQICLCRK